MADKMWTDKDYDLLKARVAGMREAGLSWRECADKMGPEVSGSYLHAIMNKGTVPRSNEQRIRLGMRPVRLVRNQPEPKANYGDAEEYFRALKKINPVRYRRIRRIANAY